MYDYCEKCGEEINLEENIKDCILGIVFIKCPICKETFEIRENEEAYNNS